MRFSYVVSSGLGYRIPGLFETNSSFTEFADALKLLHRQGFSGVELNMATTERKTLSRITKSIRKEGVQLAAVGTGLLYLNRGLHLTDRNVARRRKAISAIEELIKLSSGERATVIIGLIRGGILKGVNAGELLRKALVECDRLASEYGTSLALEAINRYETYLLNTAAEVVEMIHEENLRSTGLLLDTFHMNIEETSIEETVRKHRGMVAHFHIADSNRCAPGLGHLQIQNILKILEELGYQGWVSTEVLSKPDNVSAVISTAGYLRERHLISDSRTEY